jgi:serine/threonine protein kinase
MSLKGLCEKMKKEEAGPFPLDILLTILGDISAGMQFIHSQDIAHRDMNLGNFLITKDFHIKVFPKIEVSKLPKGSLDFSPLFPSGNSDRRRGRRKVGEGKEKGE